MEKQVTTSIPCCLTGSRDALVVATRDRRGNPLRTVISTASGLVFTDPRPTPEEVREFYSEQYRREYKNVCVPRRKHVLRAGRLALKRLNEIRPYITQGSRMLDAGSGGGEFVYTSRELGYDTYGIEPNRGYAQYSIDQYGIDVFNGFYQDVTFDEASFDCVTMFHVLEHLEQPVASLRQLSRFLKGGGHLVVEVPDVMSTGPAPGQKWHIGHLYNFSPATLAAAGMRAGLAPVMMRADGGVVFAVFTKTTDPQPQDVSAVVAGNFEETYRVLSAHTTAAHYLKLHTPLSRMIARGWRSANERRVVRRYQNAEPRRMLDDLVNGASYVIPSSG